MEHFPPEPPLRIEWIDDTSANIVYATPAIASKALSNLSLSPTSSVPNSSLELRAAKTLTLHPESSLQVRIAFLTDQKRPRAYEASRFYMMHPEYDPREQHHRDRSSRPRPGHVDYRKRRYGREEHRRRNQGDHNDGFNPTMYDDDSNALARRADSFLTQRGSRSSFSSVEDSNTADDRGTRTRFRGDKYRPGRSNGNGRITRDRSASPGRSSRSGWRDSRRRTPPPPYQAHDPHPHPSINSGKELFPTKSLPGTDHNNKDRELFANKRSAANLKKELFPNKSSSSNHRRSDAFDAADETADMFASGLSVPLADGDPNSRYASTKAARKPALSYGRLKGVDIDVDVVVPDEMDDGGLSIRGTSHVQVMGFSIRGVAEDVASMGATKELFPGKVLGNAGKELFAEKLQGRGGKRNRAEDMFY